MMIGSYHASHMILIQASAIPADIVSSSPMRIGSRRLSMISPLRNLQLSSYAFLTVILTFSVRQISAGWQEKMHVGQTETSAKACRARENKARGALLMPFREGGADHHSLSVKSIMWFQSLNFYVVDIFGNNIRSF